MSRSPPRNVANVSTTTRSGFQDSISCFSASMFCSSSARKRFITWKFLMSAPARNRRASVVRAQSSSADKNSTRPGSIRSSLRGNFPPRETSAAMYSANSDLPRPGSPTSRVITATFVLSYRPLLATSLSTSRLGSVDQEAIRLVSRPRLYRAPPDALAARISGLARLELGCHRRAIEAPPVAHLALAITPPPQSRGDYRWQGAAPRRPPQRLGPSRRAPRVCP